MMRELDIFKERKSQMFEIITINFLSCNHITEVILMMHYKISKQIYLCPVGFFNNIIIISDPEINTNGWQEILYKNLAVYKL